MVRESSELEALPAVVMETDSDDLIARLLKDDEGRSLDEMYFPFMEMDEPFALISDDKQDGGNHNQEESLEMESETTSNTQNEKDLKTHYLQEEEKEQEKSDSESIASTVKSDTKRTTKNKLSKEQEVSTTAKLVNVISIPQSCISFFLFPISPPYLVCPVFLSVEKNSRSPVHFLLTQRLSMQW